MGVRIINLCDLHALMRTFLERNANRSLTNILKKKIRTCILIRVHTYEHGKRYFVRYIHIKSTVIFSTLYMNMYIANVFKSIEYS